ncbi:MAG TPA: hypothetical protein PLH60_03415 [Proteiniphilum sp.]|nr:hypothetical protein [Proteiniphilum sp.]HPJ50188.1 hypothetical protein [Proteiniphilum sp.]HPR19590.1 hypothetical protein [Proteiniphilum sp.]
MKSEDLTQKIAGLKNVLHIRPTVQSTILMQQLNREEGITLILFIPSAGDY